MRRIDATQQLGWRIYTGVLNVILGNVTKDCYLHVRDEEWRTAIERFKARDNIWGTWKRTPALRAAIAITLLPELLRLLALYHGFGLLLDLYRQRNVERPEFFITASLFRSKVGLPALNVNLMFREAHQSHEGDAVLNSSFMQLARGKNNACTRALILEHSH